MADKFDKKTRSKIMSKIRGKNTSIEVAVFRYLRRNNIYFQKHYRTKSGINIDIALPRKKKAIFLDGDFWHGRNFNRRKKDLPPYWVSKISRNIQRDNKYNKELADAGWAVLRVWEDDLNRNPKVTLKKIKKFLRG